jgi:AraC family transcriptional regulator, regulatory protein of adaptative response / DNA-3-methyladenine glycosylase II
MPAPAAISNTIHHVTLPYRLPYDWQSLLKFLSLRAIPSVEQVRNGSYLRSISYNGQAGWIAAANHAEISALRVTIQYPDAAALPCIISRVRNMFDLTADPVIIGEVLSRDPYLATLVAVRPGLRVPGAWDGFELAVRAILGQQITVSAATRLAGKLVSLFGGAMPGKDRIEGLTLLFPKPAQLAGQDIAQIGMPRARGAAIARLAAHFTANPEFFTGHANLRDAVKNLCALPGIGEWTAQYIAMRAMREGDAFPVGDVALMRALSEKDRPRMDAAALLRRAEGWRPWRAYAALHIWAAEAAAIPAGKE